MIRRIALANWRAYRRMNLELTKPVTFIVAPNGVGKTSLVQAAMWGTFGHLPAGKRGRLVRVGENQASVEITLTLPSTGQVDITRTLTAGGASTFRCSANGVDLSEEDYLRKLAEEWAADPHLLAALLFGEAGTHAESSFPIRDHLAEVMGVTPLLEAAAALGERSKLLRGEIKGLRAQSVDSAVIAAAEDEVKELRTALSGAKQTLETVKAEAEALASLKRVADAWDQYRVGVDAYKERSADLLNRLSAIVDVGEGEPEEVIALAEEGLRNELDRHRQAESESKIRAAAAGSAHDLLGEDLDTCPTCLRPLSDEERIRAIEVHRGRGEQADQTIHAVHEALEQAEQRLSRIRKLSRELRAVRMPAPPDAPEPSSEDKQRAVAFEHELAEATEAFGGAQARLKDALTRLDGLKQAAEEDAALVSAYREEAVLQISMDALGSVASRYMTERIGPLTEEVSRRWKFLFGSEGLRLEPDGSLRFEVGGEYLDLSDLSGGERVVALFVARLLIVASATRASTLWLDEPLEHLDPRRRAVVARTIVKAAEQQALEQVLVTTYEERIAQRLAVTAPGAVAVEYVRPAPLP